MKTFDENVARISEESDLLNQYAGRQRFKDREKEDIVDSALDVIASAQHIVEKFYPEYKQDVENGTPNKTVKAKQVRQTPKSDEQVAFMFDDSRTNEKAGVYAKYGTAPVVDVTYDGNLDFAGLSKYFIEKVSRPSTRDRYRGLKTSDLDLVVMPVDDFVYYKSRQGKNSVRVWVDGSTKPNHISLNQMKYLLVDKNTGKKAVAFTSSWKTDQEPFASYLGYYK